MGIGLLLDVHDRLWLYVDWVAGVPVVPVAAVAMVLTAAAAAVT